MISAFVLDTAKAELARSGVPLPVELIEAVIWKESGGQIGNTNKKSGASGLMQVMPKTLEWYRRSAHDPSITLDDLRSTDPKDAAKQIRVGIWVLKHFWQSAYAYLKPRLGIVPVDELARIASLFYVAGPGATRRRLRKLTTPTYAEVVKRYPTWEAIPYPQRLFAYRPDTGWAENSWDLVAIDKWLRSNPIIESIKTPIGGVLIAGVILALAVHFMKARDREHDNQ